MSVRLEPVAETSGEMSTAAAAGGEPADEPALQAVRRWSEMNPNQAADVDLHVALVKVLHSSTLQDGGLLDLKKASFSQGVHTSSSSSIFFTR